MCVENQNQLTRLKYMTHEIKTYDIDSISFIQCIFILTQHITSLE